MSFSLCNGQTPHTCHQGSNIMELVTCVCVCVCVSHFCVCVCVTCVCLCLCVCGNGQTPRTHHQGSNIMELVTSHARVVFDRVVLKRRTHVWCLTTRTHHQGSNIMELVTSHAEKGTLIPESKITHSSGTNLRVKSPILQAQV